MTREIVDSHELISALADGELRGKDFARALAALEASSDARAFWHTSHLAGDVLRARELARGAAAGLDFAERVGRRLRAEKPLAQGPAARQVEGVRHRPAANRAWGGWRLVAGLASFAVLAGVSWRLVSNDAAGPAGAQLAMQSAEAPGQVMIRDPRLDELLAAHQQFGGVTALQKPAGFLRSATYERSAR